MIVSEGPLDIALSAARITSKTQWIFLVATDGDGLSGLGEATLNGREDDVLAAAERGRHWAEYPVPEAAGNLPLLRRLQNRADAKGVLRIL